MKGKKDCYGTMFPDLGRLEFNKPLRGRAFEVLVESLGIGVSSRQVNIRPEGWEACTSCEHYRDCYDLSMAMLALATAVEART
jgi:hypothetical protein